MRASPVTCSECGCALSSTEVRYYTDRCEQCEQAWSDRMDAWRKGGPDPELDRVLGSQLRTLQ